jgi:nucleoside-diphosphate-sugar epimerase
MKSATKRILVTGGAGFLDSHLCERLIAQGHDVLNVDNFFTGRKDNVADILKLQRFELMRHDITFPLYVEVDEIYNLACPASPIHYRFDPVQTTKTSVHGAINMLGLVKILKAKILQAIGAGSIRSGCDPATTRANAAPRRYSSTTGASTGCACTRMMTGWSRTSSCRRTTARISPFTVMAPRPGASATLTT